MLIVVIISNENDDNIEDDEVTNAVADICGDSVDGDDDDIGDMNETGRIHFI